MSTSSCLIAIDPGLAGAIAFYFAAEPSRVSVYDMPVVDGEVNPFALRALVEQYAPTRGIIEQVGPMPRDGVRQAWRFSAAFTAATTTLKLCGISYETVAPAKWKKRFRLDGGKEGKEQSRALALRTFPAVAASFQLVKHHGRAEAALLAVYGAETALRTT